MADTRASTPPEIGSAACAPTAVFSRESNAEPQTLADPPPFPASAGRYRIAGVIGRGGMGAVWRAHDPDLNRSLAIKVLLADHRGRADLERRFLEEAQTTGQLQHPGIPPVHEIG